MGNLGFIFINVMIPVFIQIGIGYALQKKFKLHIVTLTKIIFFVFLPAMLFEKMYQTELSKEIIFSIVTYSLALFSILYAISWLITRLGKFDKPISKAFINSICFYNGGNFVLPIVQLLYSDPFAIAIQVIVILAQNITSNTIGVFNASSGSKSKLQALSSILKMPMGYAIAAALLLKVMHIPIWGPIWSSINLLSAGMVPLATFALGVQLANTPISFKAPKVYLSNAVRLVVSPILAYFITLLLGVEGVAAQVMIISAAAPTAVATALVAIEFDNEPEFASHAVFSATAFSSVTVTLVIYLVTNFI